MFLGIVRIIRITTLLIATIIQEILTDLQSIFTVQGMEAKFNVSNQTARNDLNLLVSRGILKTRTVGKRIQYIAMADAAEKIQSEC